MNKDVLINLRVNKELKEAFQEIVSSDGFTMSEVIEASMKDVVRRGMIPINLRSKLHPVKAPVLTIPFIKECIEDIVGANFYDGVESVYLFGSYAKGKATSASDVDLLIKPIGDFSYGEIGELTEMLSKVLGKKVDASLTTSSGPYMHYIQREKIQLYERGS